MHVADNALEYNQPVLVAPSYTYIAANVLDYNGPAHVVYMVPVYYFPRAVVYLYYDDVEDVMAEYS